MKFLKALRILIAFFVTCNLITAGMEFYAGRYWWGTACIASAMFGLSCIAFIGLVLRREL